MKQNDELLIAQSRLANAQSALLELDYQERVKTLRSVSDCLRHIQRFGEAMRAICINDHHLRTLWLAEIESQLDFSKKLLEDPKV